MPQTEWAAWLQAELDLIGWRQADLIEAGNFNQKTVSKWLTGAAAAPTTDKVLAIGRILAAAETRRNPGRPPQATPATALRAAGYHEVADALDAAAAGHPAIQAPMDEAIAEILAADLLSETEKAEHIDRHRRELELVVERSLTLVRAVQDARRTTRAS